MKGKYYEIDEIAKTLSTVGHAFGKHASGKDFSKEERFHWEKLGVRTNEDFEKHIIKTLKDKDTIGFQTASGKDQFYNSKTNTFISVDLVNKHGGTCFLPINGKKIRGNAYFSGQYENDIKNRKKILKQYTKQIKRTDLKKKGVITKGGYNSFYKDKKFDKNLRKKYDHEARIYKQREALMIKNKDIKEWQKAKRLLNPQALIQQNKLQIKQQKNINKLLAQVNQDKSQKIIADNKNLQSEKLNKQNLDKGKTKQLTNDKKPKLDTNRINSLQEQAEKQRIEKMQRELREAKLQAIRELQFQNQHNYMLKKS